MTHHTIQPQSGGPRPARAGAHLGRHGPWYALLVGLLAAVGAYYWATWGSLAGFVAAIDFHPNLMQDFVAHYYPMAGKILAAPQPVKDYFYTSFFAILLVPLGGLSLSAALAAWGGVQLASLAALAALPARLLRLPPLGALLFVALTVTSFPVLHNLKWGQVSALLTACVIGAFVAAAGGRRGLAGALLGFAAAVKFYPALFLVYFVMKRDLRACVAFGLTALICYAALPAAVLGPGPWLAFERAATGMLGDAGWVAIDLNSQFAGHVGMRWYGIIAGLPPGVPTMQALAPLARSLSYVSYLVALSCVGMAWLLQRRPGCDRHALPLVALFLALPFAIKTSWPHYFVYLPLCQAALLAHYGAAFGRLSWAGKVLGALPALSMLLSSVFVFNLFVTWEGYSYQGLLFLANLLLLVSLCGAPAVQQEAPGSEERGASDLVGAGA